MNQFFSFARRVKEYTRLVGKYLTDRRKRFRPHKPNPPSNVRLSVRPSVRLSVRMYAEIAETMETIRARLLRSANSFQQSATPTLTPTNLKNRKI